MTRVGYARVSTFDQDLSMQMAALQAAGCERVFAEQVSGKDRHRPQLGLALDYLRAGDTLVVWRLDRLGRSMSHLIDIVTGLQDRGVGFASLTEYLDTTSPSGRLVFHLFAALAEFERELVRERTRAGLAAARAAGRRGGRPPALDARQARRAADLRAGGRPVAEIATLLGVGRSTVYRALADAAQSA